MCKKQRLAKLQSSYQPHVSVTCPIHYLLLIPQRLAKVTRLMLLESEVFLVRSSKLNLFSKMNTWTCQYISALVQETYTDGSDGQSACTISIAAVWKQHENAWVMISLQHGVSIIMLTMQSSFRRLNYKVVIIMVLCTEEQSDISDISSFLRQCYQDAQSLSHPRASTPVLSSLSPSPSGASWYSKIRAMHDGRSEHFHSFSYKDPITIIRVSVFTLGLSRLQNKCYSPVHQFSHSKT